MVLDTVRAGARSYRTKDADRLHTAHTLRSAVGVLTVLVAQVQATLPAATTPLPTPGRAAAAPGAEILTLIARGLTNTGIGMTPPLVVMPAVVWAGTSGRRGVRRPASRLPACPRGARKGGEPPWKLWKPNQFPEFPRGAGSVLT
ncbi:hypothetical protein [Streptomyces mirabilis]|uniref:hypothetical protein n=1 Tax=Streptomyces mirabilis TaxID=68239 RepID=UPI00369E2A37